jgi:hypothetical protein
MSANAEFKQQDWVQSLLQNNQSRQTKKKHVDPYVAFPFQDDFSVSTIHGANVTPAISPTAPAASETIKIPEDHDDISVLTLKTFAGAGTLPPEEGNLTEPRVGNRVATGSN